MFDLGWSEMAVIMLVALVVIGPKDLPKVARTIGQWTGKARALARDFQRSLDDMAREAELDEIKKSIDKVGNTSLRQIVKDAVDPDDDLERAFDVEDPSRPASRARPSSVKPLPATAGPKTALPRRGDRHAGGTDAGEPADAGARAACRRAGGQFAARRGRATGVVAWLIERPRGAQRHRFRKDCA